MRIPGDEAVRQHMRALRKTMRERAMTDIQARIKQHEEAITKGEETLRGMQAQAQVMQQQANAIMTDIERRRGALLELRQIAGVPLDGSPPKEQPNDVNAPHGPGIFDG